MTKSDSDSKPEDQKISNIIREIRESPHRSVKLAVTDIDGILRGKYMHRDKFLSAMETGFGFCNVVFGWDSMDVCYDNTSYTGWHTGYPDAMAKIDLSTYRKIPWEKDLPFFLCDFEDDNKGPLEICPRQVLKNQIARANQQGLNAICGIEFEWFNFKETPQSWHEKKFTSPQSLTPGMFGYSILRSSMNQPYFEALTEELSRFGIPLEGLHTETGPGVLEAAILYNHALETADRAILFKTATKEIGFRFGIMPSFMAKWNTSLPGCSGHIHQSLWNVSRNQNLFFDEKDPNKMSALFKSYLAGQMQCLPEILPFFAPTVNSYKRLVDGFWAPTHVNWGIDNRTTSFRVIPGNARSTRLETRVPGSDINPYLAIAACIGSGLYGIEKNLQLREAPAIGSTAKATKAERLPRTLQQATLRLSESQIAREIFGETFLEHFVNSRLWEWKQFQDSVTGWELQRYFEII